jgi:hypothetical protein
MESQLDIIEKKIDALKDILLVLLHSLSEDDEEQDNGERDQTQPL